MTCKKNTCYNSKYISASRVRRARDAQPIHICGPLGATLENTLIKNMRIFYRILIFLWTIAWLAIGILALIDITDTDSEFTQKEIKPSVDFIKKYISINNRLPTNREYYTWQRDYHKIYCSDLNQQNDSLIPGLGPIQYLRSSTDFISTDQYKCKNANWNNDFAIGAWNGDFWEYYFSWTDSYDTGNHSWTERLLGLIISIGIGFIPLLFRRFKYKKEKSST